MTKENFTEYEVLSSLNPLELIEQVEKVVRVVTVHGNTFKGTVVTVDPITGSYVLIAGNSGQANLTFVAGRSVKSVSCVDEVPVHFNFNTIMTNLESKENREVLDRRMNKLKEWLEKNMIPVELENVVLKVGDAVMIHPPYREENVISSNEMVLHKILGIIERMPSD